MRISTYILLIAILTAFAIGASGQIAETSRVEQTKLGADATLTLPTLVLDAVNTTNFTVSMQSTDLTGLNVLGYRGEIVFDPAVIQPFGPNFGCSNTGTLSASFIVTCNLFPNTSTITYFAFGFAPLSGSGPLINFNFQRLGGVGSVSPLNFGDFFFNEDGPTDPAANLQNGSVTFVGELEPTSAGVTVGGTAFAASGEPVRNAQIVLTDDEGITLIARTNQFGHFIVEGVRAGSTQILSVSSKGHVFLPIVLNVGDDVLNVTLVAEN